MLLTKRQDLEYTTGSMQSPIPFNKPYLTGYENHYLSMVFSSGRLAGGDFFSRRCEQFFNKQFDFRNSLLVTSCTHALEMAAMLLRIGPGDEVIMPSYTFVSTANAFMMFGAKAVFVDSRNDHPGIDEDKIEEVITPKTKAIVVVHYAGVACDMDKINDIARRHNLYVIEDAAHSIDAYYKGKPLGSVSDISAFSFHETKNLTSGEGGLINISNEELLGKAEIIREKGTDRTKFLRGEIDKYTWVGVGSSYVLSEMNAAFLLAQLEHLEQIQEKRVATWNRYADGLAELEKMGAVTLPSVPAYASKNGHIFYLVLKDEKQRTAFIRYMKSKKISAAFHYGSLHSSKFFQPFHDGRQLPNSDRYSDGLVRLPLFYELSTQKQERVIDAVNEFFFKQN